MEETHSTGGEPQRAERGPRGGGGGGGGGGATEMTWPLPPPPPQAEIRHSAEASSSVRRWAIMVMVVLPRQKRWREA